MNRYTAVLFAWTAVFFYGCAGGQFAKIELETMRTQEMLKTYRSESRAEYEQLAKDLASLQIKLDTVVSDCGDGSRISSEIKAQLRDLQTALTEIENQLHSFSGTSPVVFPDSPGIPEAKFGDRTPEQFYQTAYNDYLIKKYDLAILEFSEFKNAFPESDLVDNALYWIGESYFALKQYEEARTTFESVVSGFASSDKYIAAMLKLGLSHAELGDNTNARRVFRDLINRFPFSEEAKNAEEQIKRIR